MSEPSFDSPSADSPGAGGGTETTEAHLRRAPRVAVFLVIGAVLGVIVALILTATGHISPRVGFAATWGYLCLLCIPAGLVVGAAVALVLDQVSRRRARLVSVERARVERATVEDPDEPVE